MLTAIKGYYEKGKIIMNADAPVKSKTDVIITFVPRMIKVLRAKESPEARKVRYSYQTILTNHWMI